MQTTDVAFRSCDACPIRHRAVCSSCDANEMLRLETMKHYRTFQAGEPIVWAGDRTEFIASVVTGTAKLERLSVDGRNQTVGLLLPSDYLGRPGRETALYNVTAVTDVTLCCFRRSEFEKLLHNTPHIAQRMLEMALDELDAARDWMFLLGRKTALEKVASFLMLIQRRCVLPQDIKTDAMMKMTLPLARGEISDYLGLTIETVSRQLTKLKADGIVEIHGPRDVLILDLPTLQLLAGPDEEL